MGLFSSSPVEKKIYQFVGGFRLRSYFKTLLRINNLAGIHENDYFIGKVIQKILENKTKREEISVYDIESEFYLLIKKAIYIHENKGEFKIDRCPICDKSTYYSTCGCGFNIIDDYEIEYKELKQVKVKIPKISDIPYNNIDTKLDKYIEKITTKNKVNKKVLKRKHESTPNIRSKSSSSKSSSFKSSSFKSSSFKSSSSKSHNSTYVPRKNMTAKEKDDFDKHTAIHGINIHDINKIALRNGVKCNKDGVLPENGWMQCIDYVKQYANSLEDVENFPRAWLDEVQKQLDAKHDRIRRKALQDYRSWKGQWDEVIATKTNKTELLQLKHWSGLGMERHQKRVDKIMETDWHKIVANGPILRPIPGTSNSWLEVWEVYQSQEIWPGQSHKMYYKKFCKLCGYDPQL